MTDFFEDGYDINDEDDDIIVLHNDETDKDEEYYLLAQFDVDELWYAVLKPTQPLPDIDDDMVVIYEIVEQDGEYSFKPIEEDERLQKVFDEFMRMVEEDDCDCGCEHCHDENCSHHGDENGED